MSAVNQVAGEQVRDFQTNFIPPMQKDSAASVSLIKTTSLNTTTTDTSISTFFQKTDINPLNGDLKSDQPKASVSDDRPPSAINESESLTSPSLLKSVSLQQEKAVPVARIRTLEELLDSSSDLDLPSPPPSPTPATADAPLPTNIPPPLIISPPPYVQGTELPKKGSPPKTKPSPPASPPEFSKQPTYPTKYTQKQEKPPSPTALTKYSPRKPAPNRSKSLRNSIVLPVLLPEPGTTPEAAELIANSSPLQSPEKPYPTKLTLILKSAKGANAGSLDSTSKPPSPSSPRSPVSLGSLPSKNKSPYFRRRSHPKMASRHNHVTIKAIGIENIPKPIADISSVGSAPDTISTNHYERLIEELKCPGCASPMKPPILMCTSGHSICSECIKVLMLCPLCSEPFIELRSRNLEALCKKAHFRCPNAAAGCTVRVQLDLLDWHEKQCMYKSMKCFMGRVWGGCNWTGRETNWKDHLESDHADKVFKSNKAELIWNMNGKVAPLAGYYVFQAYDEMFNFYQIYDRDRVLFTMTITSAVRDRKHSFAYEVEMFHKDNEALVLTQRFPVHSEYDKDILLDGTCVSVPITDLSRLIGPKKILNYWVRITEVRTPAKTAPAKPSRRHSIDFTQTNIQGSNLKSVPESAIVTRKPVKKPNSTDDSKDEEKLDNTASLATCEDSDYEAATVNKTWGTPQLHFNRKYLKGSVSALSSPSPTSSGSSAISSLHEAHHVPETCDTIVPKSKMRNMTSSLRKSFRSIRSDIIELKKPFTKKSPEKKESLIKK